MLYGSARGNDDPIIKRSSFIHYIEAHVYIINIKQITLII